MRNERLTLKTLFASMLKIQCVCMCVWVCGCGCGWVWVWVYPLTCISNSLHLVHIKGVCDCVEHGVEFIEQLDHLERGAAVGQCCETNDVTALGGHNTS